MPTINSFPITSKVATKADVGLANVDNTADANKPVSVAQAAAIATVATGVGAVITTPSTPKANINIGFDQTLWPKVQLKGTGKSTVKDYTVIGAVFPGWNPNNGLGGGPYPNAPWSVVPANRLPIIGAYDESTQEAVDWQLATMRDYGVDVVAVEVFFSSSGGNIVPALDHFLNRYMTSKVPDKPKLLIMWVIQTNASIYSFANWSDIYNRFIPYFRDENYFKVDGKPALCFFDVPIFLTRMGSNANALAAIQAVKAATLSEFGGCFCVGMNADSSAAWMSAIPNMGFDAVTAYTVFSKYQNGADAAMTYPGPPYPTYVTRFADAIYGPNQAGLVAGQTGSTFHSWCGNAGWPVPVTFNAPALTSSGWAGSTIPEIWAPICTGWSPAPWSTTNYDCIPTNSEFYNHLQDARAFVDAYRATKTKHGIVFITAANEYAEGQYFLPTAGQGYGKLEQIRAVFGKRG